MKYILKEAKPEVSNVRTFIFEPEEPVQWQAGQFVHYTLPHEGVDDRGDERWFTISSAPYEQEIRLSTRIFDDKRSTFKDVLVGLKPGDTIEGEAPDGKFTVQDADRQYVFVAGGIGITPFRSMLKQLHHEGKDIKVELLYAVRDENEAPFKDELEAIAAEHENFNITYFVGDNRIDEKVLKSYRDMFGSPYFYVSGPEPMVESFKVMLEKIGVAEDHIKLDYFPGYEGV